MGPVSDGDKTKIGSLLPPKRVIRYGAAALLVFGPLAAACSSEHTDPPTGRSESEVIWGNLSLKNFENVSTPAHQEYGTAVGVMMNKSDLNSTAFNCPVPPTATDCTWILSTQPSGLCPGEFFSSERKIPTAACTAFMIGPDRLSPPPIA